MTNDQITTLANTIQGYEFDHVFTLWPDGHLTEPSGVWAPSVYNDPDGDIHIDGTEWSALTGLTQQYGYHGAVMHSSEQMCAHIADAMYDLTDDGPVMFAMVVVTDIEDVVDGASDLIGWAIVHRPEHIYGPHERSALAGTPHRKCIDPGCKHISLD